jgi:hypothetical protein
MTRNSRTLIALAVALAVCGISAHAQQPAVDPGRQSARSHERVSPRSEILSGRIFHHDGRGAVGRSGPQVQRECELPRPDAQPGPRRRDERPQRPAISVDGKSFTLWARRVGYYATVPAPATLRELDDLLADKYGIELPLADLFRFGSPRWNAAGITVAKDIGPSEVGGTSYQHYAFR